MENAISAIRRTGAEMGLPFFVGLYAEALADSGRLNDANKSIDAALELGRFNGTYFQLAEMLMIEADIQERRGSSSDEIEKILYKAKSVADLRNSTMSRLRVAIELARRLRKRGMLEKARALVAPHRELVDKLGNNDDACAAREFF
jgi:hypothetical protein